MPGADDSLSRDLDILKDLALAAGHRAMDFKQPGQGARAWKKHGGSPVTEADMAVNDILAAGLTKARPDYGFLSEETQDDPVARQKHRCWVVDPIDGTRAFMRDDPNWCIGVSLVEDGRSVAGVIFAPELDQLYEARKGGGAWRNQHPIRVSECASDSGWRLITNEGMLNHPSWPEPWPKVEVAHPKPNATLLRLAFVAAGEWDGVLTLANKADWDLAPGAVLVEEAGGLISTHKGEAFEFNRRVPAQRSVIASGTHLHPLLVRRTQRVDIPDPQLSAAGESSVRMKKGD